MTQAAEQSVEQLMRAAEAAGQGHVFRFYADLTDAERRSLCTSVAALDFRLLGELARLLRQPAAPLARRFEAPELFGLAERQSARAAAARAAGKELLAEGRVGFVLVAGGQASRLGYDGPKGAYPVGPVTRLPLFAFHAERLAAAARRYGTHVPWAVMTSPANDAVTRAFFREHKSFGLDPQEVFFFAQEMLPALDDEGRVLMSAPGELFLAPNGHGGVLWGLARSGILAEFRQRGISELSYFQVDNPLARPADELFLGLHGLAGAGMSSKVVKKRDAAEKVGVLGRVDGAMGCIEYSDLPAKLREQRDADGELSFRAGNIAVHLLQRAFVEELTRERLDLPWHLARKRMKVIDADARPTEVFGTKFETFVFDALARSASSVTLEVERAHEFSPVKNAAGEDSPATCRRDLCRLWSGWAAEAGHALPPSTEEGLHPIEVSPLFAETKEEFLAKRERSPHVHPHGHHYA